MEIKVGRTRVHLSYLQRYQQSRKIETTKEYRKHRARKPIYRWDCRPGANNAAVPAGPFTIEPSIQFATIGKGNKIDLKAGGAVYKRLLKSAGLVSAKELNDAVLKVFPAYKFQVPWDKVLDPYKANYSLVITQQVYYADFLARPLSGKMSDYFVIALPQQVLWWSLITHVCAHMTPKPFGRVVDLRSTHFKATGAAKKALADHEKQQSKYLNDILERLNDSIDPDGW